MPHTITRRLILQKARSHFTSARRLITLLRLVGTRVQVLFHDPSPGHFSPFPHGTCPLSVIWEYLGLPGGPGRFTRDFTGPALLGNSDRSAQHVVYGTLTHSGRPLACRSTTPHISDCVTGRQTGIPRPTTPPTQPLPGITRKRFRLDPLSLATTHGITCCFLFHRVLRCFTSPGSLHTPYTFRRG